MSKCKDSQTSLIGKEHEVKTGSSVLLGETTSLDPDTGKPCPARIVERDGAVFLVKTLSSGKTQNVLVEQDAEFYRRFGNPGMTGPPYTLNNFVYVTSRCNLKCPVCYEGARKMEEPSLEMLCSKLPKIRGRRVALCGAEPTCRDDLPDLIREVSKRHVAMLMTNGLKLVRLREGGLTHVVLSFNGLNDDVFRELNGQALLDIKLKALDNLEQFDIHVSLSATITRGVNEDQIGPLFELEKSKKCIDQLRFRSMTHVGHYVKRTQFCMSEFAKLICKQGGIDYDLWLNQQDFYDHLGRTLGIDYIRPRLCAMRADLDKNLVPLASDRNWQEWDDVVLKKPRLVARLLRNYGLKYAFEYALGLKTRYQHIPYPKFRYVTMRLWPNLDTIDLNLNRRCSSLYYKNGEVRPFCLCNIQSNT